MTIFGLQGRPRSGKTLLGVKMTDNYYREGYYAVSNVKIDFTKSQHFKEGRQTESHNLKITDIEKAINDNMTLNELYQANRLVIYISEMMQYALSRKSSSNTNVLIAYMLSQLGKTNTTFIWDAQLNHTVDIILRELTEYLISCYKLTYTANFKGQTFNNALFGFKYEVQDNLSGNQKPYLFFLPAKEALKTFILYETSIVYKADTLKLKISDPSPQGKYIKY